MVQTAALAPHKMTPETRPPWFFKRAEYGGILAISHRTISMRIFFSRPRSRAEVVASQVGNVHHPEYPELEDFGDVMLSGDGGAGYIRVDWFTPAGLSTYGDSRLTIIGTDGYMELRKTIDIAGRPGGDHLFLVDQKAPRYIDCADVPLPYGERLVDDVLNRTTTADSQVTHVPRHAARVGGAESSPPATRPLTPPSVRPAWRGVRGPNKPARRRREAARARRQRHSRRCVSTPMTSSAITNVNSQPASAPTTTIPRFSATNPVTTRRAVAPSAMRTPTSRLRSDAVYETTA